MSGDGTGTVCDVRADAPESLRPDARLVPCAAAAWAATLLGLAAGWRVAAGLVLVAGVAAATLVCVRRFRRRTGARTILAVLVVVAGFGTAAGVRMWAADHHPLADAAEKGSRATVVLVPTDDPRHIRAAAFDGSPRVRIPARLEHLTVAGRSVEAGGAVVVFAPAASWTDVLPGQRITARVKVAVYEGSGTVVAVLRADDPPRRIDPPPAWQRWAGAMRHRLADAAGAVLPADRAGLLPGLIVGDTSALTDEVREDFRVAGLTHLTAVSGANVSIVLGAVLLVVRAVGLGPRIGTLLAATALAFFVVLVRPSASVVRAAAMGSIGLLAFVTGRERQALPALCAAVGALLIAMPDLAVDVGFALSVSATAALIVAAPPVVAGLERRGWPRPVAETTAMAAVASVVTAPIVAAISGTVSLVSIGANVLVAPVLAPLTVLGSALAVVAPLAPGVGGLLARGTDPMVWWLVTVADRAAALPSAQVSVPGGPAGAATVLVFVAVGWTIVRHRRIRVAALVAAIAAAAVWLPVRLVRPGWPAAEWLFVACDVGQGDALVLAAGEGRAVVVDTGPEPAPVDRCLRRLRIRTVTALVLTHLHADHTGGATGVLAGRTVETLVLGPGAAAREGGVDVLRLAADAGIPVREIAAGAGLRAGDTAIRVLAPAADPAARPVSGSPENDASLILAVDTVVGRILLPGDAEAAALDALVRSGADVRADVLKLPHHGSRTTPAGFLTAVRPRVAVVSAGADNLFGHPHPEIVTALRESGARVWRTDLHGDVAVIRAGSGALAVVSAARGTIEP